MKRQAAELYISHCLTQNNTQPYTCLCSIYTYLHVQTDIQMAPTGR